jgi:hypothetical protein
LKLFKNNTIIHDDPFGFIIRIFKSKYFNITRHIHINNMYDEVRTINFKLFHTMHMKKLWKNNNTFCIINLKQNYKIYKHMQSLEDIINNFDCIMEN